MTTEPTVAVTGATGYTGTRLTTKLLQKHTHILNLTNHPDRNNPFNNKLITKPFHFDNPQKLTQQLQNIHTLYNTYWIRYNKGKNTYRKAVQNSRTLIEAAHQAEVKKIVHISITNPTRNSPLPYFRGKAEIEDIIKQTGITYHILRPTVLYSTQDVLINNIAWCLRRFPIFTVPGTGTYSIQPVHVNDLADYATTTTNQNETVDVVGPEVFGFRELVTTIRDITKTRCLIIPAPKTLTWAAAATIGAVTQDKILTHQEIQGLTAGLMVSTMKNPILGPTRLTDWLKQNSHLIGTSYTSETKRHYQ